jgi:predicted permease
MLQVALAMVLLVSSGLMARTFRALHHVDPGFSEPSAVETARVGIPATEVKDPERVVRTEEQILRKIEAVAGVSQAAMVSLIPLDGGTNNPVFAEDHAAHQVATPPIRRFKFISPGYISAIGSRLIAGRDFTWTELYARTPVALVSENMAREFWRDPRAAVGKRIRANITDDWREIIGVVADLRDDGVDQKAPGIVYWPLLQKTGDGGSTAIRSVAYVIRSPRAGSAALRREIQQAVTSVNASLPIADVKTLESVYEHSLARTTFTLVLLATSGSVALILGVVGIYGVVSYSVSQRTREVGIRLALGASLRQVTGLFLGHSLLTAGIGAICGLGAALALTRLMKSLLFDVSPADPLTYAAASAGLMLAVLFGSYLPVRRAAKVDPVEALRIE